MVELIHTTLSAEEKTKTPTKKDDFQEQPPINKRVDVKISEVDDEEIPKYGVVLEISEDEKKELFKTLKEEIEVIEGQQKALQVFEDAEVYRNQYWGKLKPKDFPYANSFNIHVPITMKNVNQVEIRTKQAFFDSDPIFSVSPRPGEAGRDGFKIAKQQEEFLDYENDVEMRTRDNMQQTFHDWANLGVGYLKLAWVSKIERICEEAEYEGKSGLDDFFRKYGEERARKEFKGIVSALEKGEKKRLYEEYDYPVYNAPLPSHVKYEDLGVDTRTEGIEGLRNSHLIYEKLHYTWFDLQQKVKEDFFKNEDIDYLRKFKKEDGTEELDSEYLSKDYDIRECIYHYQFKKDEEEKKVVIWIDFEKEKVLRVVNYPYWHRRPYYIPFFLMKKKSGWYQPGLAYILHDTNVVANACMNFMLDTAFLQNIILFKVKKNSDMWRLLLSRKWYPGMPIGYDDDPKEIEQFNIQKQDLNGLLSLLQLNHKMGEDISGIPQHLTGQESPTDPTAPATKTLALIKEGNVNVKEYILNAIPSMNEIAFQVMELFYQFSDEDRQYRVLGKNEAFKKISRDAFRYRTDYQSQAYGFDFEKINEARVNAAVFQMFNADPEVVQNPMGRYNLVYETIKGMGSGWDKKVDKVLLSPEERKKQYIKDLKDAVGKYVEEQQMMEQREAMKQKLTMESDLPAEEIVKILDKQFPIGQTTEVEGAGTPPVPSITAKGMV